VLQIAIWIAQKNDIFDSQDIGSIALFLAA